MLLGTSAPTQLALQLALDSIQAAASAHVHPALRLHPRYKKLSRARAVQVCLSLLGTWSGPSWDPQTSSVWQLLVSTQAQIFVADPYFNEPGFEREMGTQRGNELSKDYNDKARAGTLKHAIVAPLSVRAAGDVLAVAC